jgi:sRNA-binding protein
MTSPSGIERGRGAKESGQVFGALRARWPLAFPIKPRDVRPLAGSVVGQIAATMGWSTAYTRGVLLPWKMGPVYCRAVLVYDRRIALDGTPAEGVDAKAKGLATQRLAQIAAKAAEKAAKKAAKEAAKEAAAPEPAPPTGAPPAAPASLRDQVRASLLSARPRTPSRLEKEPQSGLASEHNYQDADRDPH